MWFLIAHFDRTTSISKIAGVVQSFDNQRNGLKIHGLRTDSDFFRSSGIGIALEALRRTAGNEWFDFSAAGISTQQQERRHVRLGIDFFDRGFDRSRFRVWRNRVRSRQHREDFVLRIPGLVRREPLDGAAFSDGLTEVTKT